MTAQWKGDTGSESGGVPDSYIASYVSPAALTLSCTEEVSLEIRYRVVKRAATLATGPRPQKLAADRDPRYGRINFVVKLQRFVYERAREMYALLYTVTY